MEARGLTATSLFSLANRPGKLNRPDKLTPPIRPREGDSFFQLVHPQISLTLVVEKASLRLEGDNQDYSVY